MTELVMPKLMTIPEARERLLEIGLPCSVITVERWIRRGELGSRKVGGRRLVAESDLCEFVKGDSGGE